MTTKKKKGLSPEEAAKLIGKNCSAEAVRKHLASGELKGRNMGGSVGWVTTEEAVAEFIENGNADTTKTTANS